MKINPLVTNRRVLTLLCVCPADETVSKGTKLCYTLFTLFVIVGNLCGLLASSLFFVRFVSSDLEMSLHSLLQMCALTSAIYMSVVGFLSRRQISNIFEHLLQIYISDSNKDTYQFLEQANLNSERISIKYLIFVLAGFFVNTITMSGVSVVICRMLKGNFDPKYVYHPFQVLVPWNKKTLRGYVYEICFDAVFGDTYLLANGSLLLLFISICLHHKEFARRFSHSLHKLNYDDKERNNKNFLCELINFHISVKDWFWETAEVYSRFILVQLVMMTVYLACVAFQLDIQIRNFGFGIIIMLISVMVGVSNLFVYCFFGKVATESFSTMADSLYEANWQKLPVEFQKYFILMIGNAHRPLFYQGFNIAILNLETFSKLLRNVFTFFTLFKTLTSE